MNKTAVIALIALLPGGFFQSRLFAASKEQMEMQRDIAQLQDQVRTLQSGFDQKMAALQVLVQQALDAGNKTNTSVSVLNSNVTQTLERELRDRLTPVAGLAAKVVNVTNDVSEVKNSLSDMNSQFNKLRVQLTDINNAIKVLQAPPPAPPAPDAGKPAPPPPASTLFSNAMSDYSGGKMDLAVSEFTDFVKFYPEDPNAPTAQLYIGLVHQGQPGKIEQAILDFDTVLERFPESKETPDAWLMKGAALERGGHRDDAAKEFRALIKKYPKSDQAKSATDHLKGMGLTAAPAPAPARKRPAQ